ncbi:DMT family protein [Porphyromonadaceae bacterium OttesenSCG-928-L07]|nr:DMT family protein [Porphyromonadaceae bacterium OttesenSCG-928-L07]MDL2251875.1 DMT family protein [Odoribacter sp. OttesenSCG-928-J03]MDL2330564.1 DMT family protein [Odoribacter sp. OttesenSCG-928-A06]
MKGLYTILLLIGSNVFMTFAWYGHLKLQQTEKWGNLPLYGVILLSWLVALFEYSLQIPANRMGFQGNGGPFSLMQLKIIQEVITLVVFIFFSLLVFKGEALQWNHIAACLCLVLAVYFVFLK